MASTEAALRLRPDFRVASESWHFELYLIEKVGLDEGYGFGDIGQFIKSEKLPYVFYYGTLYSTKITMD